MSVTHLVGQPVYLKGRTIQRCLVCGEKLLDSKGGGLIDAKYVRPRGEKSPDGTPTLPINSHVRVDGDVVVQQDEEKPDADGFIPGDPPIDLCIDLVE